jgi:hypothetical protein
MRAASAFPSALALWAILSVAPASAQTSSSLPDVVGIRPGMSAQEAYNALKTHSNGAKVGVGQMMLPGVTDKPVAVVMSVRPMGVSPGETITVWLTLPPNRQTVWAVRRTLEFEPEILKTTVLNGLRQKYGPETDPQFQYWAFDEQGAHVPMAGLGNSNCYGVSSMGITVPQDTDAPLPATPLIYVPDPPNPCTSVLSVRAELGDSTNRTPGLVRSVAVYLKDMPLARRSQVAYQAALAGTDAAKRKEETDRARQQKTPTF